MDSVSNAQDYEKELTRIFNRFNKHFWNNELPEVIITFAPTKRAHGHLTVNPVWESEHEGSKYELNISANTIGRSPEEICATLLHEQCHLYAISQKPPIKDTSNNYRYHNNRFKLIAESHGLIQSYDDTIGWSHSELTEESKAYVKKLNVKQFTYQRTSSSGKGGNLIHMVCPNCGRASVYCSSPQHVLCGSCKYPLKVVPKRTPKKKTTQI